MKSREYLKESLYAMLAQCKVPVLGGVDYLKRLDDDTESAKRFMPLLERPLRDLSGGERRKVEFCACMLAVFWMDPRQDLPKDGSGCDLSKEMHLLDNFKNRHKTKDGNVLLVLDEPTTGLDWAAEQEFLTMVGERCHDKDNLSVVVTTHALNCLDLTYKDGKRVFDNVVCVQKTKSGDGCCVQCNVTPAVPLERFWPRVKEYVLVKHSEYQNEGNGDMWGQLLKDMENPNGMSFERLQKVFHECVETDGVMK